MDFASELERSAALRTKVAAMERALVANPSDKGLRISLLSARKLADRAESDLMDAAAASQIDLCRYRLQKQSSGHYTATSLANSVISFQDVVTALYNFVENGAKSVARYSERIREQSALNVAYTFPGSMGVLFSVPNDRNLFNEGKIDGVMDGLDRLAAIHDVQDVRQVVREMGLNVVRTAYRWADHNWHSDYSVDVVWTHSNRIVKGGIFTRNQFLRMTTAIKSTSDEQIHKFTVVGTLVGMHVLSDTFSLATENGTTFSGRLSSSFDRREYKIPREYRAKIAEITTVNYATEMTSNRYELLSLSEV